MHVNAGHSLLQHALHYANPYTFNTALKKSERWTQHFAEFEAFAGSSYAAPGVSWTRWRDGISEKFKVQDKPLIMMRPANQLRFIKMTSAEVFAASYQRHRIRWRCNTKTVLHRKRSDGESPVCGATWRTLALRASSWKTTPAADRKIRFFANNRSEQHADLKTSSLEHRQVASCTSLSNEIRMSPQHR